MNENCFSDFESKKQHADLGFLQWLECYTWDWELDLFKIFITFKSIIIILMICYKNAKNRLEITRKSRKISKTCVLDTNKKKYYNIYKKGIDPWALIHKCIIEGKLYYYWHFNELKDIWQCEIFVQIFEMI